MVERNWAGQHRISAPLDFTRLTSVAELQSIVSRRGKVRGLGSRHSFNTIADTAGDLDLAVGAAAGRSSSTHRPEP